MHIMDANMQSKVAEVVRKIQEDPELLKEFMEAPAKAIEKVAGINIPDFLEPAVEKIVKEQIASGSTGSQEEIMALVSKFLG